MKTAAVAGADAAGATSECETVWVGVWAGRADITEGDEAERRVQEAGRRTERRGRGRSL